MKKNLNNLNKSQFLEKSNKILEKNDLYIWRENLCSIRSAYCLFSEGDDKKGGSFSPVCLIVKMEC